MIRIGLELGFGLGSGLRSGLNFHKIYCRLNLGPGLLLELLGLGRGSVYV